MCLSVTRLITGQSLLMLCAFSIMILAQNLEYSDIEEMGASCSPRDTCNGRRQSDFKDRSCECDTACNNFNDCCVDARNIRRRPGSTSGRTRDCLEFGLHTGEGAYAVSDCQTDWNGPEEIRSQCEDQEDISDPLAAAPVTDVVHNITYKNRYCAHCNDADAVNLRSWDYNVQCDALPDSSSTVFDAAYIEDHLTFVDSEIFNGSWGIYYPESIDDGERQFYPCKFSFQISDRLSPYVRYCRPNLVSSCAASWRGGTVRRRCAAYMAVIYVQSRWYRNPHCVLCNSLSLRNHQCMIAANLDRRKPALSFAILLDVNLNDGPIAGQRRDARCENDEEWDRFFRRCRSLSCVIPGYVVVNDECVKPS